MTTSLDVAQPCLSLSCQQRCHMPTTARPPAGQATPARQHCRWLQPLAVAPQRPTARSAPARRPGGLRQTGERQCLDAGGGGVLACSGEPAAWVPVMPVRQPPARTGFRSFLVAPRWLATTRSLQLAAAVRWRWIVSRWQQGPEIALAVVMRVAVCVRVVAGGVTCQGCCAARLPLPGASNPARQPCCHPRAGQVLLTTRLPWLRHHPHHLARRLTTRHRRCQVNARLGRRHSLHQCALPNRPAGCSLHGRLPPTPQQPPRQPVLPPRTTPQQSDVCCRCHPLLLPLLLLLLPPPHLWALQTALCQTRQREQLRLPRLWPHQSALSLTQDSPWPADGLREDAHWRSHRPVHPPLHRLRCYRCRCRRSQHHYSQA